MIKKYVLVFFVTCILLCNLAFSQQQQSYIIEFYVDTTKHQMETTIDTVKTIFFLDGKKVSIKDIAKGVVTESIEWHSGGSGRTVLLRYGEKYRNHDIHVYITRKRDEKDEKDN